MRILSCHIENFGKLHNFNLDFEKGLNCFCKENGWGKSTFAAFVRAMFFGLEGDRKKRLIDNERKRYKPWQGGTFGGNLRFETEGKVYEINRIFGDKDGTDEFELRDAITNLPSNDYSKKIGEELFRIDRESFLRTIFIRQNDCETFATDGINARLGRLEDQVHDMVSYDKAYASLTEIMNKLTPDRVTGSLARRKQVIQDKQRLIHEGANLEEELKKCSENTAELKKRYDVLEKEELDAQKQQMLALQFRAIENEKKEWERLKQEEKRRKTEKDAIGDPIPTMQQITERIRAYSDMERAHERMHAYKLTDEERTRFDVLSNKFANGIPSQDEIDEMWNLATTIREMEKNGSEQLSDDQRLRMERLELEFAEDVISASDALTQWDRRCGLKEMLSSRRRALEALETARETDMKRADDRTILTIVASFVAMAALSACVFTLNRIAGAVTAVVGGIFILLLFIHLRGKTQQESTYDQEYSALEDEIHRDCERIRQMEEMIREYLRKHNRRYDEASVSEMLTDIHLEYSEYIDLKRQWERNEQNDDQKVRTEEQKRRQRVFLQRFGADFIGDSSEAELYELQKCAEEYVRLSEQNVLYGKALREYEEQKDTLDRFLGQYMVSEFESYSERLEQIRNLCDDYYDACKLWENVKMALEEFETAHNIANLGEMDGENRVLEDPEELNREILERKHHMEIVRNEILRYNKDMDALREQYDEWEDAIIQLQELQSQQENEQKRYDLVAKARAKLSAAKEALTAKYAEPVFTNFQKYIGQITDQNTEGYHLDANSRITVEQYGKQRGEELLSAGCKDLLNFCLRISLSDAMFCEERPVLILDDPFCNLDDDASRAACLLLRELSERYQILYFTCSANRMVMN